MFPLDIKSCLREQGLREMIDEANRRFEALSEEDQVLHLLSRKLSSVRGCTDTYEKQLSFAQDVIAIHMGPKFARRVIDDPEILKRLHLDRDSFIAPSERMTTVAQDC